MVSGGFAACEGDLNCDGVTDGTDLATFAADFGATGCGTCVDVLNKIAELESRIADLEDLLANVSKPEGTTYPTIRFSDVNVQIVNGTNSTNGTVNGLGNLIIGYNEIDGLEERTGSHNLVVGMGHTYSSYGGFVAGRSNNITGLGASVVGGFGNTASGDYSSVSGGGDNTSDGNYGSISGGRDNKTDEDSTYATVSGGRFNEAIGENSSVTAGWRNQAIGKNAIVSGGANNISAGDSSNVSGGLENTAGGDYSAITGGYNNQLDNATSYCGTISGGHDLRNVVSYGWRGSSCLYCTE
jgi:hypothetical protein